MPFVQRIISPVHISRATRHPKQSSYATDTGGGGASTSTGGPVTNGDLNGTKRTPQSINDNELETVTNLTLCNALRQLASLILNADEIFVELNKELCGINARSAKLKVRISTLHGLVEDFDPKLVAVPESDLETVAQIKNHFTRNTAISTSLFTAETRTNAIKTLYNAAGKPPIPVIVYRNEHLSNGAISSGDDEIHSPSDLYLCTPVLSESRKRMKSNVDVEIETRLPAAIEDLRRCTSTEAFGDITVPPDCAARVGYQSDTTIINNQSIIASEDAVDHISSTSAALQINNTRSNESHDDEDLDHRLPSPEEQCQIIAAKFPVAVIRIDISGRQFDRMSAARKSMTQMPARGKPIDHLEIEQDTVKRRLKSRKPRGKRRNTIAGTDQKEIEGAITGKSESHISDIDDDITIVPRSKSSDILKQEPLFWTTESASTAANKPSTSRIHFNSLKLWGKSRLKFIMRGTIEDKKSQQQQQAGAEPPIPSDLDQVNVYEANGSGSGKRKQPLDKDKKLLYERKSCYSSSEKSLIVQQTPSKSASINPVKMRESSSNRVRRNGLRYKDEPHSSSGNWSASSESGRTSIGSEITVQPKSSASSNSLNQGLHLSSGPPSSIISRRKFLNTSASSSVNSDGTMTPELHAPQDPYDDETSSSYSCDTEGYYTSFHVDSGLKPLKEEEIVTPNQSSSTLSNQNSFGTSCSQTFLSAENEYEMYGRGSTSTTTSSAGTVVTTLMAASCSDHNLINNYAPSVPERKSSLTKIDRNSKIYSSINSMDDNSEKMGTIKRNGVLLQREVSAIIHPNKIRNDSPDSGHNTSSSPVESNPNSSPVQNEFEYSESSDLECVDRIERIRDKTCIDRNKIPSICVITPMTSDDESSHSHNIVNNNTSSNNNKSNRSAELKNRGLNNMLVRLKTVLPNMNKKSPAKESMYRPNFDEVNDEYVTLAEVNVSHDSSPNNTSRAAPPPNERNLAAILSGNLNEETEYVSLNELPSNIRYKTHSVMPLGEMAHARDGAVEHTNDGGGGKREETGRKSNLGESETYGNRSNARVLIDAHGRPVYNSDSLKRRKGAHTTFAPGPYIREAPAKSIESSSPTTTTTTSHQSSSSSALMNCAGISNRKPIPVRPVVTNQMVNSAKNQASNKILIRAPVLSGDGSLTREIIRKSPVTTVVAGQSQMQSAVYRTASLTPKGAYVNMQDMEYGTTAPNEMHAGNDDNDVMQKGVTCYEDYQHPNYEDIPSSSSNYISSTLPRSTQQHYTSPSMDEYKPTSQFYTLQHNTRPSSGTRFPPGESDALDGNMPPTIVGEQYKYKTLPIEELYSSVNKSLKKKQREEKSLRALSSFQPKPDKKSNEEFNISPIDPRGLGNFETSTPSKEILALANSSVPKCIQREIRTNKHIDDPSSGGENSGRSTPRLRPQSNREENSPPSAHRLGTNKTTLLDFKRLLLSQAGKVSTSSFKSKPSAVELLKVAKPQPPMPPSKMTATKLAAADYDTSGMDILNFSGSPKTFAVHRRAMNRQGIDVGNNAGNQKSPSKSLAIKHYSPKSSWRLNSPRTNLISTAIPEATNEDENLRDSLEKLEFSDKLDAKKVTPIEDKFVHIPIEKRSPLPQIKENTVIEDNLNIRDNIFLRSEENNFMRHEIPIKSPVGGFAAAGITRSQFLQMQKAQFLETTAATSSSPSEAPPPIKPPTVVDAVEKKTARSQSPSLETAL